MCLIKKYSFWGIKDINEGIRFPDGAHLLVSAFGNLQQRKFFPVLGFNARIPSLK